MVSWANSGARDLHLELRDVLTPGARGAKDAVIVALRDAARSGRLPPGTMLPASRTLAADLGLARNTVADAYAELVAEGWFASRQGAGTWVSNTAQPHSRTRPREGPSLRCTTSCPALRMCPSSPEPVDHLYAPRARRRAERGTAHERCSRPCRIAFCPGRLPGPSTRRSNLRRLDRDLRRGASGVELLNRVLGGPLAVEAYGLHLFRDAITAAGGTTVPIAVDGHGAVVEELEDLDVAGVLLTPAHHNPLGMPLHPSRRTAVVEWARRTGRFVLDDDYDGEFRFDRQPVGALQALDPGRVCYLGSVSRAYRPPCGWAGWLSRRNWSIRSSKPLGATVLRRRDQSADSC